ncbi:Transducin beta-like protein [Actinidia chinensis var. chinensis]|uniref:Transducin beta-like protein n=1 Tax=Actinidia chinensis var. chinensis TaxID=1590841 RepID=A0A2R6Q9I6_ACTCC|nr:Transducin beta-like protein [Actinidia chinensis var. chinensis]
MASVALKKNYRCVQSLQQFYSGGPFAVSSDGSFLVCACNDTIKIVDSSNSSIKSTIEGDSEPVTALALSPNDTFLFSSSHSRQIRVWDISSLKCLRSWKGHEGPVMAMACDASGGLLATAGADRKVLVWDVDGGFCTHFFKGHKGVVTNIMFHPDPNRLILFSGSDDTTVRVWDLGTKRCIATLEKHFSTVTSLSVSEDGWTLLSAGRDKVVNLWDLHDYGCKVTVPTYEVLEAVCVIPSSSSLSSCLGFYKQQHRKKSSSQAIYFITVGERGTVRLWNSDSAVCIFEQKTSDVTVESDEEDLKRGFTAAVMLPLSQGLLCVTADQQFLFYSLTEYLEGCLKLTISKRLVGHNEEIVDMKFLGEDEQFLAVATSVEQVRVYDLASMSCSYVLAGHTGIVLCLDTCVSSSGRKLIVTGSKDNSVRLWEAESTRCLGVGVGHTEAVGAIAFSKKHRNFFVSGSSDRTLKVWSLDVLSDDIEQSINLKAKAVVAAHDKDINSLAVAPNDSFVCSGSQDRTACIWRLPDLVSVVVLRGHKRGIWSVEFSPVDQCVITASGDKTIKIWAISDGSCLKTFEGHTSSVYRASFLTRGTQIVSCGADGLVKLWTVKTNECIATYDQHEDKVWALAVGKKTEMLATGGSDAVVNLWHDSTASDKKEAFLKEEEGVLRGQELENAVSDADFTKAIQIALELRRPHKLFKLFAELCRKREAEVQMDKALHVLGKEECHLLLEYVREWNTKPKLCHIAQFVLFRVFNILPPTEILEIRGIGELLEGLIPYCQRHFSRIDRLERSTFLLDYTLMGMSVIEPEMEDREAKDVRVMQVDTMDADNEPSAEAADKDKRQTLDEIKERASSKKRKSNKSRDVAYKKVKGSAHAKVSAISSLA